MGLRCVAAAVIALVALMTWASASVGATPQPTPSTDSPSPSPTPTADPVRSAEYWLDQYGVTKAWERTRGAGVTIAIIDTGIAADIRELDGAVVGGTDVSAVGAVDGRRPVGAQDQNHGTYVASLAAARGTSETAGMIGVAPEANLLSISLGFGTVAAVPFEEQVPEAIRWAVDNGADIINLSFTTNERDWPESWDDAFVYAAEQDVLIVVAAGNRGSGTNVVGAPATIPGVLTVGGVDRNGAASREASTQGITIKVSAPSEHLLGLSAQGEVVEWSGTSGAAPIVAGIAALVRAEHPDLDVPNVINRMTATATPPTGGEGRPDPLYGFGLINAERAVIADVPIIQPDPADDIRTWVGLHRRADTEPEPAPTSAVVTLPPIPPAERPTAVGPIWLPSERSLREVTLPLVALSGAGILVSLGVVALVRRTRASRSGRSSRT